MKCMFLLEFVVSGMTWKASLFLSLLVYDAQIFLCNYLQSRIMPCALKTVQILKFMYYISP